MKNLKSIKAFGVIYLIVVVFFGSHVLAATPIKNIDVAVSSYFNPLLLRSDGTVFRAGPPGSDERRIISELGNDNAKVFADDNNYYVIKNNGDVWSACSVMQCNMIGRGSITNSIDQATTLSNWGKIEGLSGAQKLSVDGSRAFAIDDVGNLWAWGMWVDYWTNPGTVIDSNVPINYSGKSLNVGVFPNSVSDFSHSSFNRIALASNGAIYTWSYVTLPEVKSNMPQDKSFTRVFASDSSYFALTAGNELYGWGLNNYGQLLDGAPQIPLVSDPVLATDTGLGAGEYFVEIIGSGAFRFLGLTNNKSVYVWGRNDAHGILGTGDTNHVVIPIRIADNNGVALSDIEKLETANPSFALRGDGQLFSWGTQYTSNPADNVPTIFAGAFYDATNPPAGNPSANNPTGALPRTGLSAMLYLFSGILISVLVVYSFNKFHRPNQLKR